MSKKTGFGTGLSSLFESLKSSEHISLQKEKESNKVFDEKKETNINSSFPKTTQKGSVSYIPLSLIDLNLNQPRKTFDENALEELAQSIRSVGLIQPILLQKENDRYLIVAGERRYRASIKAGLKEIPAIVNTFTDKEIKEIALIENLQREDLNPIEEAEAIKVLIDEYNLTQEEVARTLGKSRPVISNSLRLLQLDPKVMELVKSNRLTSGHARALVSIKERDVQYRYALAACDKKISVNDLEKMVSAYINPGKKQPKVKKYTAPELKEVIKLFQDKFRTKVSAVGSLEKGRIFIDFYTRADLERIYDLINNL